jgi:acyl carrier protein
MNTTDRLKKLVENEIVRILEDHEIDSTWEQLDLDSLSMVSLLRDVEDEFSLNLEYNIFKDAKINCIRDFSEYLDTKIK